VNPAGLPKNIVDLDHVGPASALKKKVPTPDDVATRHRRDVNQTWLYRLKSHPISPTVWISC
jgi:hypothetical protein